MADTDLSVLLSVFGLLVFCFGDAEAGSRCYSYSRYGSKVTYCSNGCCGSSHDRYCCTSYTGLIVALVFGGIVFVCVLTALICCCIKKKGKTGRVVEPTSTAFARSNVTVIHTGAYGQPVPPPPRPFNMYQPYATPMQPPPPYKAFEQTPPPSYTYSDPAYPPSTSGLPSAPPSAGVSAGPFSGSSQPPASTAWGSSQSQPPPPGFNVGQGQG